MPHADRRSPSLPLSILFAFALAVARPSLALTIDFEDLGAGLPIPAPGTGDPQFFYDGSSVAAGQETDFATHGATFRNDFTDFGGGCCWQGWAYSQTTDTTTPGFANQYSTFPGTGAQGSATYGVAFTGGTVGAQGPVTRITLDGPVPIAGAWFTNTTYAALSMRDGDGFAKQFGGASGSDPDFLTLTITGLDALGIPTGSAEFALADYRFADDTLDYIVDEWTWVDLSGLGPVSALEFELASSDEAFGFLNTPSYFAMDGLRVVPEPSTALLVAAGLALLARRPR
jgi:Domain of unknown function (DUF4465)